MIIRSPEPEVKILVDRDPVKASFEEWARPGHFLRTIAKWPLVRAEEAMSLDHYQTDCNLFLSVKTPPERLLLLIGHELDQNHSQRVHKK